MKSDELKNAVDRLYLNQNSKNKIICRAIACRDEKENKHMSKKKAGILLVAASLVLGVVVYGASGIVASWTSHSYSVPEYTKLPTAEECIDNIGYNPVLIEEFQNGYIFKDASVMSNALRDGEGNNIEKFKSITLRYENNNNNEIDISADKYSSELEIKGDIIETVDKVQIYYNSYMNKCVPGNYKMTDEDKRAEANGELVFSYGLDEIKIVKIDNLYFEKDGIKYCLTQIDGTATIDEIVSMAKEIISK